MDPPPQGVIKPIAKFSWDIVIQSGNGLGEHIEQSEIKLNDISTCLEDACDKLDTMIHPCGDGE